jgi:hypothetical protein
MEMKRRPTWVNWYIGGHVVSLTFLDHYLAKHGAAVGVTVTPVNPKEEIPRMHTEAEKLCRNGLQQERKDYDVATVIDLVANSALLLRAQDVTTMIERAIEIGKRLGAQQR